MRSSSSSRVGHLLLTHSFVRRNLRFVETYETVLEALADPTRRRILKVLRDSPRSVTDIAHQLPVSRPAVSQHLKVLRDGGLVAYETVGTRNLYRADPAGMQALRAWMDEFWDTALQSYVEFAEQQLEQAPASNTEG
jgi:DNA-binding transcriptional ArsR family regulator